MDPVAKAVWYIENHFDKAIALGDVAAAAGVSRYHLVRSFAAVTGRPVMRYARARRLSEAAKALADGTDSVLAVAIDAGYGSHEAFSRAFRQLFGVAPETIRTQRSTPIALVEPIKMDETLLDTLAPPRFETSRAMTVAGLAERFTQETSAGIPALWQRFNAAEGTIPDPADPEVAYGLCYNFDGEGGFDYMCGIEVKPGMELPAGMAKVSVPARGYAVFTHTDHISTIRRTWMTIYGRWFPESGCAHGEGPEFERYDARFDPVTGNGGLEIWIPVDRKA